MTANAELESVYPYSQATYFGSDGDCNYDASSATSVAVQANGFVPTSNVTQMKQALMNQPLAVSIEADQRVFQSYSSGVLDSTACGTNLDHAVLSVGWGTDQATGKEYWLVKNSWSTTLNV